MAPGIAAGYTRRLFAGTWGATMATRRKADRAESRDWGEPAAGNGLLHRRVLLQAGLAAAGTAAAGGAKAASIGDDAPPWSRTPGAGFTGYGTPSHWRKDVQRIFTVTPGRAVTGASRTPLEKLDGMITPNGLHFVRLHNGIPDIDPDKHELLIHGMVRRPLIFTLDALLRYPLESHIHFVECAGNSGIGSRSKTPQQITVGEAHGLLSCSEWTGVKLSTLLDEAGVDPAARWVIAESADAAGMSRSVPIFKCMDDAMIALYQNGEPIRPDQGFPMRLLLPGYEGNTNVKWIHRLKVYNIPADARDETSRYTEIRPDRKAWQFMLEMDVKSVIVKPSYGMTMQGPGYYEITGLAWSGKGRVAKVEVSADGGKSWADAALSGPVLPKATTRFRLPWRWDGTPTLLMSRATDDKGNVQPTRAAWVAKFGPAEAYHYNAIQSWAISPAGKVSNVYV